MRAEKSYSPLPQPTTNDKLEVQVPRMWDFIFKTTKVSGKLGQLVILDGVTVPSEKARPLVGEPVMFAWRETMAPGIGAPKFAKILLSQVQNSPQILELQPFLPFPKILTQTQTNQLCISTIV